MKTDVIPRRFADNTAKITELAHSFVKDIESMNETVGNMKKTGVSPVILRTLNLSEDILEELNRAVDHVSELIEEIEYIIKTEKK